MRKITNQRMMTVSRVVKVTIAVAFPSHGLVVRVLIKYGG